MPKVKLRLTRPRPENNDTKESDKESFSVPASDGNGHSGRLSVRMPPSVIAQLDKILASGKSPYKSRGELLRHGIVRHLGWLTKILPVPSMMGSIKAMFTLLEDERAMLDYTLLFEKLSEQVSRHQISGSPGQALRLVLAFREEIKNMPDSFWRDNYLSTLQKKFGHLLASSVTKLTDVD